MTRTTALCGACLLVFAVLASAPSIAGESDWKKIGSKNLKADNDEASMRVGIEEGFYRWLKFGAEGGKIDLEKVTVNFTGGGDEVFENFTPIKDGGETRTITIAAVVKKTISTIDFTYQIKDGADEVKITAYGRRDD
jgi:hypothetical protein